MAKAGSVFLDRLRKSRLLGAQQIQAIENACARAGKQPDAKVLAAYVVKQGWITRWQAEQLRSAKPFLWLKNYKLIEPLGEGTTARVFLAENVGLRRRVVLKLLYDDLLQDPKALERFRREIEVASSIRHPNFVQALDANVADDVHFLVMEYLPGRDLGDIVSESGPMAIDVACACAGQVADGLVHLQTLGLVHRDIKPRNLLLTRENLDGPPIIKILDLGATRWQAGAAGASLTKSGDFIGTPDFVAPEQMLDGKSADGRADIFSLGATLFYLLAGAAPIEGASIVERLNFRLTQPAPRIDRYRDDVPAELSAVIAKMLASEPDQRYQTPGEVAAALRPFATPSEPNDVDQEYAAADASSILLKIASSLDSPDLDEEEADDSEDWLSSSRKGKSGGAGGASDSTIQPVLSSTSSRLRSWAVAAGVLAVMVVGMAVWTALGSANVVLDWPVSERSDYELRVDGVRKELSNDDMPRLDVQPGRRKLVIRRKGYEPFVAEFSVGRGDIHPIKPAFAMLPETRRQRLEELTKQAQSLAPRDPAVIALAGELRTYGAAERRTDPKAAAFVEDHLARLPSALDAKPVVPLPKADLPIDESAGVVAAFGADQPRMGHWYRVNQLEYSRDGAALFSSGDDMVIKHWNALTGELLHTFEPAREFALSPDGSLLAGNQHGLVNMWELPSGDPLSTWGVQRGEARKMLFTGDGKTLVVGLAGGGILGFGAKSGVQEFSLAGYSAFANHPNGSSLILVDVKGTVQLYAPAKNTFNALEFSLPNPPNRFELARDRKQLFVNYYGQHTVEFFDIATRKRTSILPVSFDGNFCVTADGKTVLQPHYNGFRSWNVQTRQEERIRRDGPAPCLVTATTWDNQRLAVGDQEGAIRQFELETFQELPDSARRLENSVRTFAPLRERGSLILGLDSGVVVQWDPATDRQVPVGAVDSYAASVAASSSANLVAAVGRTAPIKIWDIDSGDLRAEFPLAEGQVIAQLAFSPDGKWLAAAKYDGGVDCWDVAEMTMAKTLRSKGISAFSVRFSPSGQLLARTTHDGVLAIWSMPAGTILHEFAQDHTTNRLAFTPDGKTLGAANGRILILWDPITGIQKSAEPLSLSRPPAIAFDPSDRFRALASNGKISLSTLQVTTVPREIRIGPAEGMMYDLAFLLDGRYLATLNGNRTVYVLRTAEPAGAEKLKDARRSEPGQSR